MPAAVRSEEVKMCCMCSLLSRSHRAQGWWSLYEVERMGAGIEEGRDTHIILATILAVLIEELAVPAPPAATAARRRVAAVMQSSFHSRDSRLMGGGTGSDFFLAVVTGFPSPHCGNRRNRPYPPSVYQQRCSARLFEQRRSCELSRVHRDRQPQPLAATSLSEHVPLDSHQPPARHHR